MNFQIVSMSFLIRRWYQRSTTIQFKNTCNFQTTSGILAGHSKWSNIRHIKAAKDGQRATIFGRLVRQIKLAIQEGGSPNPQLNSMLRNAIDDAIRKNMPMSTVQNTIKRFVEAKTQLKKHVLEINFINSPIYMICVLYSENLNSLKMIMVPVLKKAGAKFIDARHLFDDCGLIEATVGGDLRQKGDQNLEEICIESAIKCGAEEVNIIDEATGTVHFVCSPIDLDRISRMLTAEGYQIESCEHVFIAKKLLNVGQTEKDLCQALRDKLKAFDGVDEIYDNLNYAESL